MTGGEVTLPDETTFKFYYSSLIELWKKSIIVKKKLQTLLGQL